MIWDIVGGMVGLYKVVPADEAHVRIMFNKKQLFTAREKIVHRKFDEKTGKEMVTEESIETRPSYWVLPFVTRVSKLPLSNIRIDVPDVKLNDKEMAKFQCDIVCFVNIVDPILAAERTGITVERSRYEGRMMGIEEMSKDFSAIMESILRTVATKQTILDIYQDRSKLDNAVTNEVQAVFPRWGLELVDLEIKDIKDVPNSTIIADIERKVAAKITSEARIKVAQETKNAVMAEAEATREAEEKKAMTEQAWKTKRVEADREVSIKQQEAKQQIALKEAEANTKTIEAKRKLEVGQAEIDKEVIEQNAEAAKTKMTLEAEADKTRIKLNAEAGKERVQLEAEALKKKLELEGEGYNSKRKAEAEADSTYTEKTKLAEAKGLEKVAEAQQKYKDAAKDIEVIHAMRDVELKKAEAIGRIAEKANFNIMTDSTTELFSGGFMGSVKAGGKEGFSLANFVKQNPQLAAQLANNPSLGALMSSDQPKKGKKENSDVR